MKRKFKKVCKLCDAELGEGEEAYFKGYVYCSTDCAYKDNLINKNGN